MTKTELDAVPEADDLEWRREFIRWILKIRLDTILWKADKRIKAMTDPQQLQEFLLQVLEVDSLHELQL